MASSNNSEMTNLNYIMLHRKFPKYFSYFRECKRILEYPMFSPIYINVFISDDPRVVKSDIIKTIHYKKYVSENSRLLIHNDTDPITPHDIHDTTFMWIFICLIMISLLVISIYVMTISYPFERFLKPHNIKI